MSLIDKILSESLMELNIRAKNPIAGDGKEHRVYDMEKMPGYVVKQKHYNDEEKGSEMFAGIGQLAHAYDVAPELVARIAKRGSDWAVVEKLDIQKVCDECELLAEPVGAELPYVVSDIYELVIEDKPDELDQVRQRVMGKLGDDGLALVDKYIAFCQAIADKLPDSHFVDMAWGNYGYDAQGNLKLLDI